ncbi:MAG: hypothetical protein N2109_12950 [Fimbriimonadales bacterium]|nr:hypothetical protein [Fimbriimonadales bacterium]
MRPRRVCWLLAAALAAGCLPPAQVQTRAPRFAPPARRSYGQPVVHCVVRDPRLKESSGLASSRLRSEWLYTHNDSGDTPRVFRIGPDGRVVAELVLPGIRAGDCEDIASAVVAGRPYLYLGDIGDNERQRPSVRIHRFLEPGEDAKVGKVESFELVYPDGPRDAEALLVDPAGGDVYVVEMVGGRPAGIYRLPGSAKPGRNRLQRVGEVTVGGEMAEAQMITAGDISPDGRHAVLRTYLAAFEFDFTGAARREWWRARPNRIRTAFEIQSEAIAYSMDGRSLFTSSEVSPCPIHRIPIR